MSVRRNEWSGLHSFQEFPGVRPIEAPDDNRLQECRLKIPQIHSVASAGCGFNGLPVSDDTAGLASKILECPITPDVVFSVLRVALDKYRTKFVIGPDSSCAPTQ